MEEPRHPIDVPYTCALWFNHAKVDVCAAMIEAWIKHGEPTHDPVRGALTLCEEAGEVAERALDATRKIHAPEGSVVWQRTVDLQQKSIAMMCEELAQVAGYAILLMVQLQGKGSVR